MLVFLISSDQRLPSHRCSNAVVLWDGAKKWPKGGGEGRWILYPRWMEAFVTLLKDGAFIVQVFKQRTGFRSIKFS